MKVISVIPARYAATRFPGKLMQMLGNKSVIVNTYNNTIKTGLFKDVFVATDSNIIYDEIKKNSGQVVFTKGSHESGSDRIAEAVTEIDFDIVLNVQGDEPFVNKNQLSSLINVFLNDDQQKIKVASLMHPINNDADILDPNNVKVVVDKNMDALLFSRSPIPYKRNSDISFEYYKHIGIYAFRKNTLIDFTNWPQSTLEKVEKLEQLRYLENGVKIRMVITNETTIGIDTPSDLELAKKHLLNFPM